MTAVTTTPDTEPDAAATPPADASERSLVNVRAFARGSDLEVKNALVGGAFGSRLSVSRAFVRTAFGGRSLALRQAGAGVIATGGGASIQQGGAQAVVTTGAVSMDQAGSVVTLARSISVDRGVVVFGITPRLEVGSGGRVVFGPLASLAIVGAVAGVVTLAAVASRVARGRAG